MNDSCPTCVNTYNELADMLSARESEFDEFLMQYAGRSVDETVDSSTSTSGVNSMSNGVNSSSLASIYMPHSVSMTNGSSHNGTSLNLATDFSNDYEEDDLIDIDDDFYYNRDEEDDEIRSLSSAGALILLPHSTKNSAAASSVINCSTLKQPNNRLIQKSLSEKKLRRNNSFRAAIENLTSNASSDANPPRPGDLTSLTRKQLTRSSTIFSSSDAVSYTNSIATENCGRQSVLLVYLQQ